MNGPLTGPASLIFSLFSSFSKRQDSRALSRRFPIMTHNSTSPIPVRAGTEAFTFKGISLALIRESLLFKMASTITFPVFTTVSTVVRSSSRLHISYLRVFYLSVSYPRFFCLKFIGLILYILHFLRL